MDNLDLRTLLDTGMSTPNEKDLNIALGRWDFDIDVAIKKVKDDL
jgi:hypothetical protein